jgi:hypothetical protein
VLMFTFELICMLLEGFLKILLLGVFFGVLKNIEFFGFLEQAQPAYAIF